MLHHEIAGSGPTVLFIHSGVADLRMWEPQWVELERDHRVIRCDLPGFGQSPVPAEPYVEADVVAELLGPDPAAVVGASYGGMVALQLASRHPQLVERLILLSPAWDIGVAIELQRFDVEESALLARGDIDAAVELNVRAWLGPDATPDIKKLVAEMQRQNFTRDPEPDPQPVEVDLRRIEAPTTVVTGAHDFNVFHRIGHHLVRTLPHADRIHLEWAGHLPSLERPEEVTDLLRASLAQSR